MNLVMQERGDSDLSPLSTQKNNTTQKTYRQNFTALPIRMKLLCFTIFN